MSNSSYPESFIRGISRNNSEYITKEGYVTQAAFSFDDYNPEQRNNDGFRELSINWLDDEGAIEILLKQINSRRGEVQFQGGYCQIALSSLNSLRPYIINGHLSYERSPVLEDKENGIVANKYHGNLLLHKDISNKARTNLQIALAVLAGMVIHRQEMCVEITKQA